MYNNDLEEIIVSYQKKLESLKNTLQTETGDFFDIEDQLIANGEQLLHKINALDMSKIDMLIAALTVKTDEHPLWNLFFKVQALQCAYSHTAGQKYTQQFYTIFHRCHKRLISILLKNGNDAFQALYILCSVLDDFFLWTNTVESVYELENEPAIEFLAKLIMTKDIIWVFHVRALIKVDLLKEIRNCKEVNNLLTIIKKTEISALEVRCIFEKISTLKEGVQYKSTLNEIIRTHSNSWGVMSNSNILAHCLTHIRQ